MPQYEETTRLRLGSASWFIFTLALIVMALAIAALANDSLLGFIIGTTVALGLGIFAAYARNNPKAAVDRGIFLEDDLIADEQRHYSIGDRRAQKHAEERRP